MLEPKGGTCDMDSKSQSGGRYEFSHRSFFVGKT
jgi:hypothetical protein